MFFLITEELFNTLLLYGFILIYWYSPPKFYTNSNIIIMKSVFYNKIRQLNDLYYLMQQILFFYVLFL